MAASRRSWLTTLMLGAAGIVASGSGCKRKEVEVETKYGGPPWPEPPKYGGPPPMPEAGPEPREPVAGPGGWRGVASRSRTLDAAGVDAAARRLGVLSGPRQADVVAVLDKMAANAPTAAGLRAASKLAHDSSAGQDPSWAGSGSAPNIMALHEAGMAVLRGLIATACERARSAGTAAAVATELLLAIRQMPLPRLYNSGGLVDGRSDRDALENELRAGVDDGAWKAALEAGKATPPAKNPPL